MNFAYWFPWAFFFVTGAFLLVVLAILISQYLEDRRFLRTQMEHQAFLAEMRLQTQIMNQRKKDLARVEDDALEYEEALMARDYLEKIRRETT